MRKHIAIVGTLLGVFIAGTYYAINTGVGSTTANKMNAMKFEFAGFALVFLSLLVLVFSLALRLKIWRNYSALSLALTLVFLIVPWRMRTNQQSAVISGLESTFHKLANAGAPFPTAEAITETFFRDLPSKYSFGYWVAEDQKSFELYYHDSSNSFTLAYPNEEWDWRDANYSGPVEDEDRDESQELDDAPTAK